MSRNSVNDKGSPRAGFIFGPVSSRRLGLSLGIDLLPAKICSHDCIYCEVGATTLHTCERSEYLPTRDIEAEIIAFFAAPFCEPDCFTITASGEPTLHTGLGRIIRLLKEKSDKPVVVLTNGTTMVDPEVRRELSACDLLIPSLDAVSPEAWRRVNRPAPGCPEPEEIISALSEFRKGFEGEIWLEILLVKGVNDSEIELDALSRAADRIKPDRIQLNTVVRPPTMKNAKPLSNEDLARAKSHFHGAVEIIAPATIGHSIKTATGDFETRVTELLKRRPCPVSEISNALDLDPALTETVLARLITAGRIKVIEHQGRRFFINV